MIVYFTTTTNLSTYHVLNKHNNVPDAHQGAKIFLPKFLWTSLIPIPSTSILKNNDWTTRGGFHFQGGLHANYIRIL
jgi:hypothetical protein